MRLAPWSVSALLALALAGMVWWAVGTTRLAATSVGLAETCSGVLDRCVATAARATLMSNSCTEVLRNEAERNKECKLKKGASR